MAVLFVFPAGIMRSMTALHRYVVVKNVTLKSMWLKLPWKERIMKIEVTYENGR